LSEEVGKGLIRYRSYQLSHFVRLVGLWVADYLNCHRPILAARLESERSAVSADK
jgi:hypothetical protein